jgi:hypothetical protein
MDLQEKIKVDKILEEWENHCQLMQGETKEKWLEYINTIKNYVNK